MAAGHRDFHKEGDVSTVEGRRESATSSPREEPLLGAGRR